MKPKLNRPATLAAAPCSVERTHRSVIEHKLLTALEDENTVAALLSKQDLEDMIAALYGYEIGEWVGDKPPYSPGSTLSWEAHMKRRKELADSMRQLLCDAFPPNAELADRSERFGSSATG